MFELTSVSDDQYVSLSTFGLVIVCVFSCIFCLVFSDGRFAITKDHVRFERKSWFFPKNVISTLDRPPVT